MARKSSLYITTLGQFALRRPGRAGACLSDQDIASPRQREFLQYLSTARGRTVSQEEIIEAVWGDADIANPVNTLKTLLHRSRCLLERLGFPDGKQVLLYRRGFYSWSEDLDVRLDLQEFDELADRFSAAPDTEEGLDAARQALALYGGDFLPNAAGSPWTLSPRAYYHNKYMGLCRAAAEELRRQGQLEEASKICQDATTMDPYDMPCQMQMMRLLRDSGSRQLAVQHYSQVSDLFLSQLGVAPSEEMTALYRSLSEDSEETMEMDLRSIRSGLQEDPDAFGAFFCDYPVFQSIYQLITRTASRSGQAIQLGIVSLFDKKGRLLAASSRSAAMDTLKTAILLNLRSGDVFTQFSSAQYLILLTKTTYENGRMALDRVLSSFDTAAAGTAASAQSSLLPALSLEAGRALSIPAGRWT